MFGRAASLQGFRAPVYYDRATMAGGYIDAAGNVDYRFAYSYPVYRQIYYSTYIVPTSIVRSLGFYRTRYNGVTFTVRGELDGRGNVVWDFTHTSNRQAYDDAIASRNLSTITSPALPPAEQAE
jgi:hypothetical protein